MSFQPFGRRDANGAIAEKRSGAFFRGIRGPRVGPWPATEASAATTGSAQPASAVTIDGNQTMTAAKSLDVPGVTISYKVRGSGPFLFVFGSPMATPMFAPLADALADHHTVVTHDPRGIARSTVADPPSRTPRPSCGPTTSWHSSMPLAPRTRTSSGAAVERRRAWLWSRGIPAVSGRSLPMSRRSWSCCRTRPRTGPEPRH